MNRVGVLKSTIIAFAAFMLMSLFCAVDAKAETIDCSQKVVHITTYEELKNELENYIDTNETIIFDQTIEYRIDETTAINLNNPHTVFIDFNGYDFKFTSTNHNAIFYLDNKCDLRLVNSTDSTSTFYFFYEDSNNNDPMCFYHLGSTEANLTIYNIDHRMLMSEGNNSNQYKPKYAFRMTIFSFEAGNVDIRGGKFINTAYYGYVFSSQKSNPAYGSITIAGGGKFYSRCNNIYFGNSTHPVIKIYDATFESYYSTGLSSWSPIMISGGITFSELAGENLMYSGSLSSVYKVKRGSTSYEMNDEALISLDDDPINYDNYSFKFYSNSTEQHYRNTSVIYPGGHLHFDYETGALLTISSHDFTGQTEETVEATCTAEGGTRIKCKYCGYYTKTSITPMIDHEYTNTAVVPATLTEDGRIEGVCNCGAVKTISTIYKVTEVSLSPAKAAYDGTAKSATVVVKDSKGKTLVKNTDYTVSTPKGRKDIGVYDYVVTLKGNYDDDPITLKFAVVPVKISSLKAENTSTGIKLTWSKSEGADGYCLYRKEGDGKLTKIKTTTVLSYTDTDVKSGTQYQYKVYPYIKIDGVYYKGDGSNYRVFYNLQRPVISNLSNASTGVKVSWNKVAGADNYIVYRSDDSGATYTTVKTTASTSFTDSGANVNGKKYYYQIVASKTVDGKTYKSYKSASKYTYFVSRPVISSLTSTTEKKITVKWDANKKAKGYIIECSPFSNFDDSTRIDITSNTTVSKTITLTSKTKYYVRIAAFYTTSNGTEYKSQWSAVKTITVK